MTKKINNPSRINIVLKDATLEELDAYIRELTIFRESKAEELQEAKRKAERLAIFMAQNEISGEVLFANKVFKRRPKYVYIDDDGQVKTWAGVGRTPSQIQKQIDAGASLEEFEIKDPNKM